MTSKWLSIVILFTLVSAAPATMMVKRLSVGELTAEAKRIVHGRVTDVQSGRDEFGAPATWVTIAVSRALKGQVSGQLTIKQFGADEPLPDGAIFVVAGLPRYALGEEIVLFLRGDSGRGFTSPVGLGQGVYRVTRAGGEAFVRSDLPAAKQDLDTFLSAVERSVDWGR